MAQDYLDQLQNGVFILKTSEKVIYDSLEKEFKRVYETSIVTDKNNVPKRKFSSIKEYGIAVADANITDVDYQQLVDDMIQKKVKASTSASVSKQELLTAQQKQLTAKAMGEQKLVEIEYQQKQEQTKQVVAAQTKVELAKQDMEQQRIQSQAAELESKKIKTLADANAYAKRTEIQANGALEQKLATYREVQKYWADAFGKYTGSITPMWQNGVGANQNAFTTQMDIINVKTMRDMSLDLKNK
jgi:DNA-binding PadR family transcriptional regulator